MQATCNGQAKTAAWVVVETRNSTSSMSVSVSMQSLNNFFDVSLFKHIDFSKENHLERQTKKEFNNIITHETFRMQLHFSSKPSHERGAEDCGGRSRAGGSLLRNRWPKLIDVLTIQTRSFCNVKPVLEF